MQAVSLVVVLLLSDGTTAGRATLLDTLSRSLDPSLVNLQPRVLGDSPPELLTELSRTHPVVEIRWETPRRAVIRAALKPESWTSRTVEFGAKDPLNERAKTLGFAVAAMMPQWRAETAVADPPMLEVVPLSESDFVAWVAPVDAGVIVEPEPVDAGVVVEPPTPNVERAPVETVVRTPEPIPSTSVTRGFLAVHTVGRLPQLLGGGGVDGAYCVLEWLCLGAQATFGAGPVSTTSASHLELRVLAIADVRIFPWAIPLGFTLRAGGGTVLIAAARGTQTVSRWTGTGGVEAGLALRAGRLDFTLTGGPTFSGPTQLFIDDVEVAGIAAVQGALRLGAGWRF